MRILPFLVLLSALAIAGIAAFFSIVGLKLLFVGGGVSIIVMGSALEVGKLITATFLKQRWEKIGFLLKTYLIAATLVLVGITSIGIYGYLSAGYNTTSVTVQSYQRTIDTNTARISELEKEISFLKSDKYNESEISSISDNRKLFVDQRLVLVNQKNAQIEKIRAAANDDKGGGADITIAKQALELSKQALDSDTTKELEQIKLYNSRLEILDKEVQKWMDEGAGGLFKKSGLDKARVVKEGQAKERADIDAQIKSSQDRIEKLRQQYATQVKEYNDRVASIESRGKSQKATFEENIKTVQKEIADTMASIDSYNKEMDSKLVDLNKKKEELIEANKKKISENQSIIKSLHAENDEAKEKIVHTDVGTFKFIAKSLNIELDKAVNYFVWTIMFVFDPLAVCLILAYNSLLQESSQKKSVEEPKAEEPPATPEPVIETPIETPKVTPTPIIVSPAPTPEEPKIVEQTPTVEPPPPPPPVTEPEKKEEKPPEVKPPVEHKPAVHHHHHHENKPVEPFIRDYEHFSRPQP